MNLEEVDVLETEFKGKLDRLGKSMDHSNKEQERRSQYFGLKLHVEHDVLH